MIFLGNKHLNEAMKELVNEFNLAWIGAFPGVKVRNVSVLIYIGMFPA